MNASSESGLCATEISRTGADTVLIRFLNPVSISFSAKQSRLAPFKTLKEPLNYLLETRLAASPATRIRRGKPRLYTGVCRCQRAATAAAISALQTSSKTNRESTYLSAREDKWVRKASQPRQPPKRTSSSPPA